jgi:hypothetical protein
LPPPKSQWRIWDDLSSTQILHFNWSRKEAKTEEVDLRRGIKLKQDFADPDGLLDTASDDLRRSLSNVGLAAQDKQDNYCVNISQKKGLDTEAYIVQIEKNVCFLFAGDIEGARRAIYHFEEMLLSADGPFLPLRQIERKPWLKNRISRSMLSPTNRPPNYLNELDNDIDYYPEAYLNRLAREGVNALWLPINFKDICHTFLFPDSRNMEQRLIKLQKIVEKCRRYGIRIFVLAIEPAGVRASDQILDKYPEIAGFNWGSGLYSFCPSSEVAQRYLYDATHWLFSQVKNLGGLINITLGEACSSCLHCGKATDPNPVVDSRRCPRCHSLPPAKVLSNVLTPMRDGMLAAAPNADLICWFYHGGANNTAKPWVYDLAAKIPERIILLYNFESGMLVEQAGKPRLAGDYWQSQVGPSARFINIAGMGNSNNTEVAAKIQVSNSHEIATVSVVPAPGILHKKYQAMRENKVSHVMQCWYFGGSPGLMNRAAGRLAFHNFDTSEKDFLKVLAKSEWKDSTPLVVKAWELFEEAYSFYPVSQVFQYYGPMHAGIVWPLFLMPRLLSLSPNWLDAPPSGDAIGECLKGYSLQEAVYLCRMMSEKWNEGLVYLRKAARENLEDPERQTDLNLAEAINIQFQSGYNILNFYLLREKLLNNTDNHMELLDEMREIVQAEILRTNQMLTVCKMDSRLGYNSEAETYKYYPGLLKWRIKQLEKLLQYEFPRVKQRIANGQGLCDISAILPNSYQCNSKWHSQKTFRWRVDQGATSLAFSFESSKKLVGKTDLDQICMLFGDAYAATFPFFLIFKRGVGLMGNSNREIKTAIVEEDGVWRGRAEIAFELLPADFPKIEIAFNIFRQYYENDNENFDSWGKVSARGFCFCNYDPAGMGRILPTGDRDRNI